MRARSFGIWIFLSLMAGCESAPSSSVRTTSADEYLGHASMPPAAVMTRDVQVEILGFRIDPGYGPCVDLCLRAREQPRLEVAHYFMGIAAVAPDCLFEITSVASTDRLTMKAFAPHSEIIANPYTIQIRDGTYVCLVPCAVRMNKQPDDGMYVLRLSDIEVASIGRATKNSIGCADYEVEVPLVRLGVAP